VAEGVVDAYPKPAAPKQISLRHQKVGELLGVSIPAGEQVRLLQNLGLRAVAASGAPHVPLVEANVDTTTLLSKEAITSSSGAVAAFEIPTFRVDIKREVDLIEEIARLYGVEKIPATPPRGAIGTNAYDAVHDQIAEARRILAGLGLNEAQGQTLVANAECRMPNGDLVPLANPLSSDMDVLRPSLLPGLIHSLRHNVSRKNYDVALFEVGRVFSQTNGQFREERRIAIALTGQRNPLFWSGEERDAKLDIYDLKGALEEFFEQFGLRGMTYNRRAEGTALFLESATIQLGKQQLGELGQLLPPLAKKYDLRDAVFLAELNLDLLLARRNPSKSFKSLPAFPSIRRDVAMIVPEATTHDAVLQVVKQTKPANLESVELFDVFRGKNVPEGQKSLAYAFTYRNPEKTLTDAEATAAHEKLVEQFKKVLQASVRE
jgi:phenylalanyl-tRNA synthetase beta chain